eukprot:2074691-Prymnesium_polylepis.1
MHARERARASSPQAHALPPSLHAALRSLMRDACGCTNPPPQPVPLPPEALAHYRGELARYERHRLQTGEADGRKLWTTLEGAVRTHYAESGVMAAAFAAAAARLILKGRRPLVCEAPTPPCA